MHEKSLRLPQLRSTSNLSLSHTWRPTRAKVHPQILLKSLIFLSYYLRNNEKKNISDRNRSGVRHAISEDARSSERSLNKRKDDHRARSHDSNSNPIALKDVDGLLRKAALLTNIKERTEAYKDIIRRLCESGYYNEAWDAIVEDPGVNRNAQIAMFFLMAPLDLGSCLAKMNLLSDSIEKETALSFFLTGHFDQISRNLEDSRFKSAIESLLSSNPNALIEIIGSSVRNKFDLSASEIEKEEINNVALDLFSKKLISGADFATIIARNGDKDPVELWSWISNSSMGFENPDAFEGQARNAIIQAMVRQNSGEMMDSLKNAANEFSGSDLSSALKYWTLMDSKAANDWYVTNSGSFNDFQH